VKFLFEISHGICHDSHTNQHGEDFSEVLEKQKQLPTTSVGDSHWFPKKDFSTISYALHPEYLV